MLDRLFRVIWVIIMFVSIILVFLLIAAVLEALYKFQQFAY